MKIRGAEAVIRSLIEESVDIVFGYPGGAIMPVYDALYDYREKIRHILVRHEQGAAHAAEGYAWATGRPGVCIVTSGPGATNLVTGITDAMMDSVPIVCIAGQVSASVIGTDAFQEADIIGITAPVTKWNYQITDAREIPKIMARAFHIACSSRPGPVVLDITKNAQTDLLEFSYPKNVRLQSFPPATAPDTKQIARAADLINAAERPFILAGHGILIAKAQKELMKVSEIADAPVALTHLGLSAVPFTYKRYVGVLGMHGHYAPNLLTNKADVILAVGMRFHDRVTGDVSTYAKQADIIHIDIDAAELNKNVHAEIPIVADAKEALQSLIPRLKKAKHPAWHAQFSFLQKIENETVISRDLKQTKQDTQGDDQISMAETVKLLSDKTNGKAIIVADVGQHQMAAMRYYEYALPDSHITSGGLGTMGFALPAAIGAKLGKPEREVLAIIGDGSFQMTLQELGTIFQEQLPVNIVILNNRFLGMVRQWQELFFNKRYSFVKMQSPDFVKIAEAYQIPAERVDRRDRLAKAIDRMLTVRGPYLLEVMVKQEDNVFPMIPAGAGVDDILLEPKEQTGT